jgi:hypothetical protein
MDYMFLVYTTEETLSKMLPEEMEAVKVGHLAVMQETKKLGILKGVSPLYPTSSATTVRIEDGKMATMDGPFAETKEQLAGYYVLDCKDLDEAIAWAAKIPTSCGGGSGCIEIRPLRPMGPQVVQ